MKLIQDLGMHPVGRQGLKARYGIYECPVCDKHFKILTANAKSGSSTKCLACASKKRNMTHDLSKHKLHAVWNSMKQRCSNSNNAGYHNYGGRGIKVCPEWFSNFKEFYDWAIQNGYQPHLTIERVDNNSGYSPNNCAWIPSGHQARNRRDTQSNASGYVGVYLNKGQWISYLTHQGKRIYFGQAESPVEAAKVRNNYILKQGLFNNLNVIEEE